jgi:hypothetical protein
MPTETLLLQRQWCHSFQCSSSTLADILSSPVRRQALEHFVDQAGQERSRANLRFYLAVERFRQMPAATERRELAERIFARHLGAEAGEVPVACCVL